MKNGRVPNNLPDVSNIAYITPYASSAPIAPMIAFPDIIENPKSIEVGNGNAKKSAKVLLDGEVNGLPSTEQN
jgi:hypothetical protein